MRLDKFLQASRLVRRRAVARDLCAAGRVRLNGVPARPSSPVREGDIITLTLGDRRVVARVRALPDHPGPDAPVEILTRLRVSDLPDAPDAQREALER
ncbi:MAG: S4 domain-containing protein [Armatimonadota bacterium]|nr:S4 domain-containing protein [Armatimonadota bacterium]MDR7401693.1 S4 domain-containing protein [Armatimonadota bacterium]MDR7403755.1 S4 domain-containing protein [Armatimonadota bacterium]MDR7436297.1 S4 domain-containing protein [Armatimonadota bacterium]MDR7471323.1 S4 domain-containing protein [Armatimonadota bacterium]